MPYMISLFVTLHISLQPPLFQQLSKKIKDLIIKKIKLIFNFETNLTIYINIKKRENEKEELD